MANSPTTLPETPAKADPPASSSAPRPAVTAPPADGSHGEPRTIRRSTWPWIWLAALVLIGAGLYLIWRHYSPATAANASSSATAKGGAGSALIPVVAARAHTGDIGVYYTGLGSVTPILTVTVKSRVDGQLMSVRYKESDLVHKGDLLAEIDSRPYQVQLTLAQGQLLKDQAALANAKIDLARDQALFAKKLIPEQQLATQETVVTQDEGVVKTDQGQVDSANLNISYCHITALITGRVGLRLVDPGNMVHASDPNGLVVITQMQPISVIFTISEDELQVVLKKMRAGQRLTVDAYDRDMKTKLAQGLLTALDNEIDPTTGTLRLRATFDNDAGTMFPNQFVNVRLLVEEKRGVTLIPTAAVQRNAQATYVFVVKPDQTVTSRPVVIGATEGDESEITSGLTAGEVAVMTGVDKIHEGSKVGVQIASEKSGVSAQPDGQRGSQKGSQKASPRGR
jgi:multidrug efflux system membrane fusion protein